MPEESEPLVFDFPAFLLSGQTITVIEVIRRPYYYLIHLITTLYKNKHYKTNIILPGKALKRLLLVTCYLPIFVPVIYFPLPVIVFLSSGYMTSEIVPRQDLTCRMQV